MCIRDSLNTLGRAGIWNNGTGARSRVHYGRNYVNAFWDGTPLEAGVAREPGVVGAEVPQLGPNLARPVDEELARPRVAAVEPQQVPLLPGDPGFERLLARILDGTPEVASWWAQSSLESPPPRRSGVKQVRLGGQVISLRQLVLTSPDDPDVTVISHFADLGPGDELGDDLDLEDELDAQDGWRTGR